MKRILPLLLALVIAASGCNSVETVESTAISAKDIYQGYTIDASRDQTSVKAIFRVGNSSGATIDLDAPSRIEHNGKLMREIAPAAWKGTTYEDEARGFVGSHIFVFTDSANQAFRADAAFEPLEFGANLPPINRRQPTLIPLSRKVNADENILAYLSGTAKPSAANAEQTSGSSVLALDAGRAALVIAPETLKTLAAGKAELSVKLTKSIPLKTPGKGGAIEIEYDAERVQVIIPK